MLLKVIKSKKEILIVLFLLATCIGYAQNGKRLALVVGNAEYIGKGNSLFNPAHDASDVSTKLKNLGFDVTTLIDGDHQQFDNAIDSFGNNAKDYDVALFYYSGHGLQSKGDNYMMPVDADLKSEADVKYKCTAVNHLLSKLEESGCPLKIIVLDACRNNPFTRSWHRSAESNGLSFINAPNGTFISYATGPGRTADDGTGRNSPFTKAFLNTLDIPGLTLLNFFNEVGTAVQSSTRNKQTPWMTSTAINGNFCFNSTNNDTPYTTQNQVTIQLQEPHITTRTQQEQEYDKEKNYLDDTELQRMAKELDEQFAENQRIYEIAKDYLDNADYEAALPYLLQAGEKGHIESQKELAFMYFNGYGTEQNYEEAMKWFNKAASADDDVAQYDLGYMYEYGMGLSAPDINGAIYWYHRSAKNGNKKAHQAWMRLYQKNRTNY